MGRLSPKWIRSGTPFLACNLDMALTLPMLPAARPVDPHWRCQRSGQCCTQPAEVVMTKQEAAEIVHHAPPTIRMHFRDADDGFVALKAQPCPLYLFGECMVYAHRPYACRRFACMRPDPKTEPWESGGPLGCKNLSDRVATSRLALRLAKRIQRKAQQWARSHGWSTDPI